MRVSHFSSIATKQRIDAASGIIRGVSVVTKGEAQGHNLFIDDTTLSQVRDAASKFSNGVKVRFNHPASDSDALVESTAGILKDFSVDGSHVRADLHLLKSDDNFDKIIEMSEVMPENFGLSIAFSGEREEKDGKHFARCTELYAVDLVDAPAANPTGLFSKKPVQKPMITIEKTALCKALGLPESATESEVQTAYLAKISSPNEVVELSRKVTEATTELAALKKQGENAVALAKKSELDALIAEASRDGKTVPLDVEDIYSVKDGAVTIKTEPAMLRKMIDKLPKAQVQFTRREIKPPTTKEGAVLDRKSEEFRQFCSQKRDEGAQRLTEFMRKQIETGTN